MSNIDNIMKDLVIANRILANENVVDAYGHVSIRHPDKPNHFFLARSLAPELVTGDDIMEFTLECAPCNDSRKPFIERFLHGGIYQKRADVMAVAHGHSAAVIPFGLVNTPMHATIARFISRPFFSVQPGRLNGAMMSL